MEMVFYFFVFDCRDGKKNKIEKENSLNWFDLF